MRQSLRIPQRALIAQSGRCVGQAQSEDDVVSEALETSNRQTFAVRVAEVRDRPVDGIQSVQEAGAPFGGLVRDFRRGVERPLEPTRLENVTPSVKLVP